MQTHTIVKMQIIYNMLVNISILLILIKGCLSLRNVRVKLPHTVRRGQNVTLKCLFDLEDDALYSIKWYKGRREFYCYTPNEEPPMKVFQFSGIRVDRESSNETHLVLTSVSMATTGKYSCEVSADAPSFHTLIAAADLQVVELPHSPPMILGVASRYHVGDILRGNCTSRHSKPAANLTWTVNDEEIQPAHVRHFKIHKDTRNEMQTSIIGVHYVINAHHFDNGKMKIKCAAQIANIYYKTAEKVVLNAEFHHHKDTSDARNNLIDNNHQDYDDQDNLVQNHHVKGLKNNDNYITRVQELSAWLLSNSAIYFQQNYYLFVVLFFILCFRPQLLLFT